MNTPTSMSIPMSIMPRIPNMLIPRQLTTNIPIPDFSAFPFKPDRRLRLMPDCGPNELQSGFPLS
jgi:hypothetical protein